jgi:hypothetical protein
MTRNPQALINCFSDFLLFLMISLLLRSAGLGVIRQFYIIFPVWRKALVVTKEVGGLKTDYVKMS